MQLGWGKCFFEKYSILISNNQFSTEHGLVVVDIFSLFTDIGLPPGHLAVNSGQC